MHNAQLGQNEIFFETTFFNLQRRIACHQSWRTRAVPIGVNMLIFQALTSQFCAYSFQSSTHLQRTQRARGKFAAVWLHLVSRCREVFQLNTCYRLNTCYFGWLGGCFWWTKTKEKYSHPKQCCLTSLTRFCIWEMEAHDMWTVAQFVCRQGITIKEHQIYVYDIFITSFIIATPHNEKDCL